jgi:hypothetical protein
VRAPAKRFPWVTGDEGSNPSPSAGLSKNMSNKVDEYIDKQKSPQKEICQYLRQLIKKTITNVEEEMKWGVPAFDYGNYYIVALKDHVNLGFSIKGLKKEELTLFDGGGKTTKHIEIKKSSDIGDERIIKLLKLVNKRSKE